MKRLIAVAFLLTITFPVFSQSWDRVYKMPNRLSKFLEPVGTGSVVIQQDTFRMLELTRAVKVGWRLDTVIRSGWYKLPEGPRWGAIIGTLSNQADLNNAMAGKVPNDSLPFRYRNGDVVLKDQTDDVGLGTNDPEAGLHVLKNSVTAPAIHGVNNWGGVGVKGTSSSGSGVYGSNSGTGGYGGVTGYSPNGWGVVGMTDNGRAIVGLASGSGLSGYFDKDVSVGRQLWAYGRIIGYNDIYVEGDTARFNVLNGTGTRMVTATATGLLGSATIPTSFPGFGTNHTTAAYGDHAHSGTYEPVISSGTTAQYWRGDKTWQTLPSSEPALGNPSQNDYFLKSSSSGTRSWVLVFDRPTYGRIPKFTGSTKLGDSQFVDTLGQLRFLKTPAPTDVNSGFETGIEPALMLYYSSIINWQGIGVDGIGNLYLHSQNGETGYTARLNGGTGLFTVPAQLKVGNYGYTLPSSTGSSGQVLKYPASGSTLEWGTIAGYTSPLTTRGDLIYHNGTSDARLPIGAASQVLTVYNNDGIYEPHWANPTGGHTVDSIWHTAPSGAYASTSTFTGTGTAKEALMSVRSLFRCIKSDGSVLRAGYIKSASESSGTITYTVVSTSDLASGDKNFAIAYNRKADDYERMITIPGEVLANTLYSQGMFFTDLPDTTYLLPVNTGVRIAAAGSGAALTYNIYYDASTCFSSAPDMTTNTVLREQRPTTFKLNPAVNVSLRILSSAGAGNKASDFQAKLYLIPTRLFYAY